MITWSKRLDNILDILFQNQHVEKKISSFFEQYDLKTSFTYEEILDHSSNYAKNLQEMVTVKNEAILISLDTSAEFLFSFFGVILSGNIPVPIASPTLVLPKDYKVLVTQIAKSCQSSYIIADSKIPSTNLNVLSPHRLANKNQNELQKLEICPKDICFIQFSSGSTQIPKGVAVTHQNLLANLAQIQKGMKVTSADRICSWLPLYHDMGLIGVLLASLYCNVEAYLMSPLDFILSPSSWMKLLSDQKISIIVAPNAAYNACIKKVKIEDVKSLDLSSIRLALSGAEPVNIDVCHKFIDHFSSAGLKSHVMFPVFGLAEATLAVSFNEVGSPIRSLKIDYDLLTKSQMAKDSQHLENSIEIVSCGSVLEDSEIQIRNKDKVLLDNQVGEIFIKGPNVVEHYFQHDSHLHDLWLATGDLGFLRDGLLYIVGRIKDLIIINGRNIAANDLEARVCQLDKFKPGKTIAFSYLNNKNQEKVKLVAEICETDKDKRDILKQDACRQLAALVPITPQDVYILPPLMIKKTTSGKIKRYYIKQKYIIGKIQRWEKYYYAYFLRSQSIIGFLTFKFALKNVFYKWLNKLAPAKYKKDTKTYEIRN